MVVIKNEFTIGKKYVRLNTFISIPTPPIRLCHNPGIKILAIHRLELLDSDNFSSIKKRLLFWTENFL